MEPVKPVQPQEIHRQWDRDRFNRPTITLGISLVFVILAAGVFFFREQLTTLAGRGSFNRQKIVTPSTPNRSQGGDTQGNRSSSYVTDGSQADTGQCSVGGLKPWGEYLDYYNFDPKKTLTASGIEQYNYLNYANNVWYGMGKGLQTTWDESRARMISPSVFDNPLGSYQAGLLKEVSVGEEFGYVGQIWPAHGEWVSADDYEGAGVYKAVGPDDNSGYVGPCNDWLLVYEYDPRLISVDAAAGGTIAWWDYDKGQIAFYRPHIIGCYAHCDPADAHPNAYINLKARYIAQPSGQIDRPFKVRILHRGFQLEMPNTLDGNSGSASKPIDQDGWRWQLQAGLRVRTDAAYAANRTPAARSSTSDIMKKLSQASAPAQIYGEGNQQLFLYPLEGFIAESSGQKVYTLSATRGAQNQQISVTNIFVPTDHIIAQNLGGERLAQGILGYGLSPVLRGYFTTSPIPSWAQDGGFDFSKNRYSMAVQPPEDSSVGFGGGCTYQIVGGKTPQTLVSGGVVLKLNTAGDYRDSRGEGQIVATQGSALPIGFLQAVLGALETKDSDSRSQAFIQSCADQGYSFSNFSY